MIKIINRKKYDTDTATELAYYRAYTPRDFKHWSETLYQKKTGEFFLYGEGGPMSAYAVDIGNNWKSGSSDIFPYSEEEAKDWVEKYASERYEDIFGEVEE